MPSFICQLYAAARARPLAPLLVVACIWALGLTPLHPEEASGAGRGAAYYGTPLRFDPPPVDLPGLPAQTAADPYPYQENPRRDLGMPETMPKPEQTRPARPGTPHKAKPRPETQPDAPRHIEPRSAARPEETPPAPRPEAPPYAPRPETQPEALPDTPSPAPQPAPQPEVRPDKTRAEASGRQQDDSADAPAANQADKAEPPQKRAPQRLFGTVEFRCVINDLPKWMRVMHLEKQSPSFVPSGLSCRKAQVQPRWLKLKAGLAGASVMEKARKVNSFFNQWPYKTDRVVWGVEDYWATPCEFMLRSGDCEDYAIAKYYALRDLGVPASQMRIAAIRNAMTGNGHAVLVLFMHDDAYVLDNVTNTILSHKRLTHYRPLYTVNEEFMWRHVRPVLGAKKD